MNNFLRCNPFLSITVIFSTGKIQEKCAKESWAILLKRSSTILNQFSWRLPLFLKNCTLVIAVRGTDCSARWRSCSYCLSNYECCEGTLTFRYLELFIFAGKYGSVSATNSSFGTSLLPWRFFFWRLRTSTTRRLQLLYK